MGIKHGKIPAKWLAKQSYLYRLGYVWLNVLLIEIDKDISKNPLRWSVADVAYLVYAAASGVVIVLLAVFAAPFEAHRLGTVKPIKFWSKGKPTTDYDKLDVWYYDNGKI